MREARCARGSPRGGTRLYMVRPGPCGARGRFALWAVHCVSAAPRQGLRCALNHTAPKVARHAHVGGVAPAYPAVNRLGPFESPRAGVFSDRKSDFTYPHNNPCSDVMVIFSRAPIFYRHAQPRASRHSTPQASAESDTKTCAHDMSDIRKCSSESVRIELRTCAPPRARPSAVTARSHMPALSARAKRHHAAGPAPAVRCGELVGISMLLPIASRPVVQLAVVRQKEAHLVHDQPAHGVPARRSMCSNVFERARSSLAPERGL